MAAVPAWLLQRHRSPSTLPAAWHGHEMLFGYTLLVVAGFLVTRRGRTWPWLLAVAWMAGRLAATMHASALTAIAGLGFPVMLVLAAAPPLLRGAKRPENFIVPLVLLLLLAIDALWWTGALRADAALRQHALLAAVDILALLTAIVGGRALPAAIGGYLERQGIARRARVRRGYEVPLALTLAAACLLDARGRTGTAGALCIAAGLVTLWRMAHWQLQYSLARPELWPLALGYAWLVPGLALKGTAQCFGITGVNSALHGITIGVIGTLTLVMMARTTLLRAHRPLASFADIALGAVLLSAAALFRLCASVGQSILLWLAAAAWSAAFLILLRRLLTTKRAVRGTGPGTSRGDDQSGQ